MGVAYCPVSCDVSHFSKRLVMMDQSRRDFKLRLFQKNILGYIFISMFHKSYRN